MQQVQFPDSPLPLSPISSDDSSFVPNASSDSSPNPFLIKCQTFWVVQGPERLVWTDEERAVMQAFLSYYEGKEGGNVPILEAGEGDRFAGGSGVLPEGTGLREGRDGAWCDGMLRLLGSQWHCLLWEEQVSPKPSSSPLPSLAELLLSRSWV